VLRHASLRLAGDKHAINSANVDDPSKTLTFVNGLWCANREVKGLLLTVWEGVFRVYLVHDLVGKGVVP
jgi:hypothetical protein